MTLRHQGYLVPDRSRRRVGVIDRESLVGSNARGELDVLFSATRVAFSAECN